MLKERRQIGQSVADKLFAAEAAIDAALAAAASLAATIATAQQAPGIGACIGQDALLHVTQSCGELVKARGSMIASHTALATAQKQVGLGAVNFGGWVDKFTGVPGDSGGLTGHRSLALVGSESSERVADAA